MAHDSLPATHRLGDGRGPGHLFSLSAGTLPKSLGPCKHGFGGTDLSPHQHSTSHNNDARATARSAVALAFATPLRHRLKKTATLPRELERKDAFQLTLAAPPGTSFVLCSRPLEPEQHGGATMIGGDLGMLRRFRMSPLALAGFLSFALVPQGRASQVHEIALSPDGEHLYLAVVGTVILAKRLTADGTLDTQLVVYGNTSGTPCIPNDSRSIAIAPNGTDVYVAYGDDNTIVQYVRAPSTGHLMLDDKIVDNGSSTVQGMKVPVAIALSPDGAFVYVAAQNTPASPGSLVVFDRDPSNGKLTYVHHLSGDLNSDGMSDLAGVSAVVARAAADPNCTGCDYLYVTATDANAVLALKRGELGNLELIDRVDNAMVNGGPVANMLLGPSAVAIDPTGAHLYVASGASRTIAGFKISADGTIDPDLVAGEWHNAYENTRALALSTDGTYLYVAAPESGTVVGFQRNLDGSLSNRKESVASGDLLGSTSIVASLENPPQTVYVGTVNQPTLVAVSQNSDFNVAQPFAISPPVLQGNTVQFTGGDPCPEPVDAVVKSNRCSIECKTKSNPNKICTPTFRVEATNASASGQDIQVLVNGGTCAPGKIAVVKQPDYDNAPGVQNTVTLVPGASKNSAKVKLEIYTSTIDTPNHDAPYRCYLLVSAQVEGAWPGSEATPWNNETFIEVTVWDETD